jgi:type IV secretion system protein VirB10
MISKNAILPLVLVAASIAQEQPVQPGLRTPDQPTANSVTLEPGTKIPLTLLNSLSSKQTAEGDRVYLETLYPVVLNGRIVVPQGSYVSGTVTEVKRPGRVKGRGELFLRFDSLTLPNGVTREFRARIGGMEGGGNNQLDREEGKIKGGGSKGDDARTIGQAAEMGTMVGGIAGAAGGRPMTGVLGGAGAGAAAGLAGVLLTRGPDIVLQKGSVMEMVLDRTLSYDEKELDFTTAPQRSTRTVIVPAGDDSRTQKRSNWPLPF